MDTGIEQEKATLVRVIVAFEDGFRTYQGTLAAALKIMLPEVEVIMVGPEEIGGAARRFSPHVVIGSPFEEADVAGVPAWVELSIDPARSSRVKVDGVYSEMVNPTFDKLLVIVEEVTRQLYG